MQIFFTIIGMLLIFPWICNATYFGNPAQPCLLQNGIVLPTSKMFCIRFGYMSDYLYRQNYKEEFPSPGMHPPSNYTTLSTDAGTLTLNFKNRIDLNAILGAAQMQIDQNVFTNRQFLWGVGGKLLIWKTRAVQVGLDLKYIESDQKPLYFLGDGFAYNILSDYKLNYVEMQAALGAAYRTSILSPYIYLSYLYSKIAPEPYSVVVQLPFMDLSAETVSRSIINQRRWGMAVGGTLIAGKMCSLNVESRLFNQNAINISGEMRF